MNGRGEGPNSRLPLLISALPLTVERWFLFGILILGFGVENTTALIPGPPIAASNFLCCNVFGNRREGGTRCGGSAFSSSSLPPSLSKLSPSLSSSALFATCRICRKSYDPLFNDAFSCVHHPGIIRGESPRKSNWEDDLYDENGKQSQSKTTSIDNSKLVYTYTCCGGESDSEGCSRGKCKSFDDP